MEAQWRPDEGPGSWCQQLFWALGPLGVAPLLQVRAATLREPGVCRLFTCGGLIYEGQLLYDGQPESIYLLLIIRQITRWTQLV